MQFHTYWSRCILVLALALIGAIALGGCGQADSSHRTSTPILPLLGTPTPTPLSTANWQTYTDPTFHFRAVIPPGWRVGAILDSRPDRGDCAYYVIYFPPGDTHQVEPLVTMSIHEFMLIQVNLHCAGVAVDRLVADGHMIISGTQADLYKGLDESSEVHRVVYAEFGGHSYDFVLAGTSATNTPLTKDIPLFMAVLHSFAYLD
jgi:hypothetical protein